MGTIGRQESSHDNFQPRRKNNFELPAQFTAIVLCERHVEIDFDQLAAALKRISPGAALGDWRGPSAQSHASVVGTSMLSLDGESIALLPIDAPLPAESLEYAPPNNPIWPHPITEIARHTAHMRIVAPDDPIDQKAAVRKARAVSLIAAAVATLTPVIGIVWLDASNLVPAAAFTAITAKLGLPDGHAVPFWVRILFAEGPTQADGGRTVIVGTLGLRAFGLNEIEYAPSTLGLDSLMPHALATAHYLIKSGVVLQNGETIRIVGEQQYNVERKASGTFGDWRISRLKRNISATGG